MHGSEQTHDRSLAIARSIKQAIRDEVGISLTCSIGLAPTVLLAKIASNIQKPDGLFVIPAEELPTILYPLALKDIPGIGSGIHTRLCKHGITIVKQLCALSKKEMGIIWGGIIGERMWHWLRE